METPFKVGDRVVFVGYDDGIDNQKRFEPKINARGVVTAVVDGHSPDNTTRVRWDSLSRGEWYYNHQKLAREIMGEF